MKFFNFLLGVVFSFSGFAHAVTLEDVLVRLERAEKDIKTLEFDFAQKTIVSLGGQPAEMRGTAIFQRPNLFRVIQVAPEPQTFVSNGKQFWVHLIDRGQVLKDTMDNWSQFAGFPQGLTPFQMNVAQMKEKYTFSLAEEGGGPVLSLTPKAATDFSYTLRLWVDMGTGVAMQTELASENVTAVVSVRNVKINPRLDGGLFRFVPPQGTDVLEMPLH
jgi:outer membrane lipoprotein carrier protein